MPCSSGFSFTKESEDGREGVWMQINVTSSEYDAQGNLTDSIPSITTIQSNYVGIDSTLRGTAENNTITGTDGHDEIIGGGGNDTMTGGDNSDFFVWRAEDVGIDGSPAIDTITDFSTLRNGDVLDLRDLLPDDASDHLSDYLSFSVADGDTTIDISTEAGGPVVQQIVLQDVDLSATYGTIDTTTLINNLTDNGNMIS